MSSKYDSILAHLNKHDTVCVRLDADIASRIKLENYKDDLYIVNKDIISMSMIENCMFVVVETKIDIDLNQVFDHLKCGRASRVFVDGNPLTSANMNIFASVSARYQYIKNVSTEIL